MGSLFQSIQNRSTKEGLPVSQTSTGTGTDTESSSGGGLRRRLSSLSLKIQASSSSSGGGGGGGEGWGASFRRSKSMSAMGEYAGTCIRKWWGWGWGWILSRKPTFAKDLEMNEQETAVLGCHNKGSWRHVFYKLRSELKRLLGGSDRNAGQLPQTFRYDPLSYSRNLDNGTTTLHP